MKKVRWGYAYVLGAEFLVSFLVLIPGQGTTLTVEAIIIDTLPVQFCTERNAAVVSVQAVVPEQGRQHTSINKQVCKGSGIDMTVIN